MHENVEPLSTALTYLIFLPKALAVSPSEIADQLWGAIGCNKDTARTGGTVENGEGMRVLLSPGGFDARNASHIKKMQSRVRKISK